MYSRGMDTFSNYSYRFYVDSSRLAEFDAIIRHHSYAIKLNAPELQYYNSIFWASRNILLKTRQNQSLSHLLDSVGVPYISYENKEYNPLRYVVALETDSAVWYSQKLYETGKFEFAEPDFYHIVNR